MGVCTGTLRTKTFWSCWGGRFWWR